MNRRLASIGAVLRKDALMLWPLAVPAMALPLGKTWYGALGFASEIFPPPMIGGLAGVISVLLIFVVVQNDAPASARHDWLTRPIRRFDMALAKLIFLLGAVFLPWLVGHMIYLSLDKHLPLGEVLLSASGQLLYAALILPILALASVSATKVEAIVSLIAVFAIVAAFGVLQGQVPGPTAIGGSGVGWIGEWVFVLLVAAVCALVLWLQYGRRNTLAARAAIVGAGVAIGALTFLPPPLASASEHAVQAAPPIQIGAPSVCLVDQPFAKDGVYRGYFHWSGAEQVAAGKDAKAILVSGQIAGLPQGWTVAVDRLDAVYLGAGQTIAPRGGAVLSSRSDLSMASEGATLFTPTLAPDILRSDWLMSKDQALASAHLTLHLDAALTLLKPVKTYRFPADGQRHRVEGLGYCGTKAGEPRRAALADCLNVWPVPAQLTARFASAPAPCLINCGVMGVVYTPVWAQLPTARRYQPKLSGGAPGDDVIVTVYEVAGHIRRALTIPGPAAACPMPAARPAAALPAPTDMKMVVD